MEKYRGKSSVKTIEAILIEQGIDPETGLTYEEYKKAWNLVKPVFKEGSLPLGKMIFGTIGESDNTDEWKNIFMNPESYKIIPFDNIWEEGNANKLKGFFTPATFKQGEPTELTGKQYYQINMENLTEEQLKRNKEVIDSFNVAISTFKATGASVEDISDGYHTFKELYEFRKMYNAVLFNEWGKGKRDILVYKSWKHSDGELCFGGGWFIVSAMLPTGLISNHYEAKDWDLFKIQEVDIPYHEYDGHTAQDVLTRLKALC